MALTSKGVSISFVAAEVACSAHPQRATTQAARVRSSGFPPVCRLTSPAAHETHAATGCLGLLSRLSECVQSRVLVFIRFSSFYRSHTKLNFCAFGQVM